MKEDKPIILSQIDLDEAKRRNEQIVSLVKRGLKPSEVARMFRISRQRVNQILRAANDK